MKKELYKSMALACMSGVMLMTGCNNNGRNTMETADPSGWTFSGLAATSVVPTETPEKKNNIYWGDVHNHNNVTYGHGDLTDALEAAKQHIDFVAPTPHALWPDIPGEDDERLSWVIAYHTGAFKRLREGGWEKYVKTTNSYNEEGKFLTFLSYECHSMQHGDHVALFYDQDAPLVECTSVPDLKEKVKNLKAFVTPHHMGYTTGYRGYNWDYFRQDAQTPFVEMYSRHGLAESDLADYPYLHDMGPRIYEGTIQYGLEKGYKFGIIGSTDQHAGYPASYGDGRMATLAPSLTRDAIWNAMENRHVYGATGDKIKIDFRINDAIMGEEISGNERKIYVNVEGENYIDYIDIVKNGKNIARMSGPHSLPLPAGETVHAKVKVEFGWNREEAPVRWDGNLNISAGKILSVTPCFRGAAFTSPQEGVHVFKTLVNKVLSKDDRKVDLELYTTKNPNTTTPATQAVILEVEMPKNAVITADFNGKQFNHTLEELLQGTQAHFMTGWLSEAIQFNRAAVPAAYTMERTMVDNTPERDTDYYYVRVRQRDNQWAWSSPIWVSKKK